MNIDWPLVINDWTDEETEALNEVTRSGNFTMGERVRQFEKEMAEYEDKNYAVMTNSGSSANLIALAALKWLGYLSEGDRILVPAMGWSTTYFPVIQNGFMPFFNDVDENGQLLPGVPKDLNIKGVVSVDFLGNKSPWGFPDTLHMIDGCEGICKYQNGHLHTRSFFYSHHMNCMEGGMVLTDSQEIYEVLLSLRAHGWVREQSENSMLWKKSGISFEDSFTFVTPGYCVRPLEFSAAVGLVQLPKLDAKLKRYRQNAEDFSLYIQMLSAREIAYTMPNLQTTRNAMYNSYFGLPLIFKSKADRNKAVNLLTEYGVQTRPFIGGNFIRQPVMDRLIYGTASYSFPMAQELSDCGLMLGNANVDLSSKIIQTVKVLADEW